MSSSKNISNFHPISLISTFFGVGKIPFAPGTFGSLAAYPLYFLPAVFLPQPRSLVDLPKLILLYLFCIFIIFMIGTYCAHIYSKRTSNSDPKEVVIDEVVGQLLTLTFTLPAVPIYFHDKDFLETVPEFVLAIIFYSLAFLLFRLFDITKPWPINWCDKNIKGGFGIMFDDVVAAFAAITVFHFICMMITDYLVN